MARRIRASEVDVARPVIDWLRTGGWEVWQEVPALGVTADMVADRSGVLAVVESKTSMSLALIGQARRWIGHCHMVWVAVPRRSHDSAADGAEWICNLTGVGLLYVGRNGGVREAVTPAFLRRPRQSQLRKALRPEQQDGSIPAGTASGRAWTPWRVTVTELARHVSAHPGTSLSTALDSVKTHYSSRAAARRSLSVQALRGMIPGVTAKVEEKDVRLWPR